MTLDEKREIERARLKRLKGRQPKTDDFGASGVVLSDKIRSYCNQFSLIDPFVEANLHPASYKLRIGDLYAIGGKICGLSDEPGKNELEIPPFEVAIIKTRETLSVPRFLIGRWNIQVKRAYQGLVWVGGPQVDPGYVGHLFCPIYNLSNDPVKLHYEDTIAVIDFVRTSEFDKGASQAYHEVPELVIFEDYPLFKSALQQEISGFRERIKNIDEGTRKGIELAQQEVRTLSTVTYIALTVLVAALAVIATSHFQTAVTLWTFLAFWIAVLALVIAWRKRP
jgi:deoxycytidine triphosphate deaminase